MKKRTASEMRKRYLDRLEALRRERQFWLDRSDEIAAMLMPWRGPVGSKRRRISLEDWQAVIDTTGTDALQSLVNGMLSASMSSSQDWFASRIGDSEADVDTETRQWCSDTSRLIHRVFQGSNVYEVAPQIVTEQAAFGMGAALALPDFENVIRLRHLPAGEYCVAEDERGVYDTLYREFHLTVGQAMRMFGDRGCSRAVRRLYDQGHLDSKVPFVHIIEPRHDRDERLVDQLNKPWRSLYFEQSEGEEAWSREGGFDLFPALIVPWERMSASAYGHGPGVYAHRAIVQLQHEHVRKAQGIDYQTKPPLGLDISSKGQGINLLPGGINYVGANTGTGSRALFESRLDLTALREDMQEVRQRIREAFKADLFRMFSRDERSGTTALEIAKRYEENLLQLSSVAQRNEDNLQEPLVKLAFHYLAERGMLPPAPPQIQSRPVEIQFLGLLAQAQQSRPILGIERFLQQVAAIGQVWPEAYDLIDADHVVQQFGAMLQVPPRILRRPETVAEQRIARNEAMAAKESVEMAVQQSKAAKQLSDSTPTETNLLGQLQAQGAA